MSTYKTAKKLAEKLAVDYLASNIAEMMVLNSKDRAMNIKAISDKNEDQLLPAVQEYRNIERIIYSSIYELISGYDGYKIVEYNEVVE